MENGTIIITEESVEVPIQLTAAATANAIQFTCGVMQSGTFGAMPETHTYSVYLQGNKSVAFASTGLAVVTLSVFDPSGSLVGTIGKVASSSYSRFGVLTLPNKSGYYTVSVYGACGSYTMNCLTGQATTSNTNSSYNRAESVKYANKYWQNYNSNYPNYDSAGGDCTNFVSQCVHAGGVPMKTGGTTDAYWHYTSGSNRSPSWTDADFFMRHWTKVRLSSYYGQAYSVKIYTRDYILNNWSTFYSNVGVGDIIQYAWSLLDFDGTYKNTEVYHSAILTEKKNDSDKTINFHSHSSYMNEGSLQQYIHDAITSTEWILIIRISNN
ncbi:MAG: amidase domain-containing protein [Clostridiales bacterium]|nr:amidase domain-containing protein [Clostridiales bacterium]